ncbi:TPA: FRG domain-containing protein [Legionella pneumophila]|nr:FRG domain-containing protein [Legionella pneumophila]
MNSQIEDIPSFTNFDKYSIEVSDNYSIPISKVATWSEFLSLSKKLNSHRNWIFRGQENVAWLLTPSLIRLCCDPKTSELEEMLKLFRDSLNSMGLNAYIRKDDIEQWCIARHYGLASPALDWSYDPRISLFFAFENYRYSNIKDGYSAIYIIETTQIKRIYKDSIYLHSDANLDGRINAQKGVLMFTKNNLPFEKIIDTPENSYRYFRKIYIPRKDMQNCLDLLEQDTFPISKKDIYPNSIEGAIQYCNFKFQKYFRKSHPAQTIMTIRWIKPPTFYNIDENDYHHFVLLNSELLTMNCVKCKHVFDVETRNIETHINHYLSHGLTIIGLKEDKSNPQQIKILVSMAIKKGQDIIRN